MATHSLELRRDHPCRRRPEELQGQYGTEWNLLMAAAAIATIPTVIVYLFAQLVRAGNNHVRFRRQVANNVSR